MLPLLLDLWAHVQSLTGQAGQLGQWGSGLVGQLGLWGTGFAGLLGRCGSGLLDQLVQLGRWGLHVGTEFTGFVDKAFGLSARAAAYAGVHGSAGVHIPPEWVYACDRQHSLHPSCRYNQLRALHSHGLFESLLSHEEHVELGFCLCAQVWAETAHLRAAIRALAVGLPAEWGAWYFGEPVIDKVVGYGGLVYAAKLAWAALSSRHLLESLGYLVLWGAAALLVS